MEFTVLKVLGSLSMVLGLAGCAETSNTINEDFDYGVFLSLEGKTAVEASEGFEIAVIDAQNISAIDIAEMKARDQEVYSYLNIGSLEEFRSYYTEYQHLILKPYENWEEEYWVDAGSEEWQKFVAGTLAQELIEKGIDGFWIDNTEVYGQFADEEIYDGVATILKTLMSYEKPVVINGGDQFVLTYLEQNGQVDDILTGINQETVFSSINFDEQIFTKQSTNDQHYYLDYLSAVDEEGKDIYLLEYTTDDGLVQKIQQYIRKREWKGYISDSIELDG